MQPRPSPQAGQVAVQNGRGASSKSRRGRCQRVERRTSLLCKNGQRRAHTFPKLQRELLQDRKQNLTSYVMEVTLEPV